MKELSLREIQLGELEVLKKLVQICDEQGLGYFLHAGTLIGVVRHKGFIPWDDDVDVMMPRPDYEKLVEYCRTHEKELSPFRLMHYSTNSRYIYAIARLCDTRYRVDYVGAKEYGLGLFVDIYPLDGWGNDKDNAQAIIDSMKIDLTLTNLAGCNSFTMSTHGIVRTIAKFFVYIYAQMMGANYFIRRLDIRARKRKYDEDKYVGITSWNVYGIRERINKEDLTPVKAEFEGIKFNIPLGYDRILRNMYGDYMTPPSENERIGHHYYKAYLKN